MHNYGRNSINIYSKFSTFNSPKFKVNQYPKILNGFGVLVV